jgi:beta-glucosidase
MNTIRFVRMVPLAMAALCISASLTYAEPASAPQSGASAEIAKPWMDPSLPADERASLLEQQLTQAERNQLVHGIWATQFKVSLPPGVPITAGYVPGISRLGVPAQLATDASLGVGNPLGLRSDEGSTPLPSGLATAATFNSKLAYEGGAMIGQEAWRKGFNVLLAGGANLAREPRSGRNFEYLGEDPLLAGILAGQAIRGIQEQNVVSTVKHFVLNDQETNRHWLNARIGEASLRESDLLAFELAIEGGHPGSVMCAYNLVNDHYACDQDRLLNGALKGEWRYPGWVMSDWGAVRGVEYALHGLDQQSGEQIDDEVYFGELLKKAIEAGTIPQARLSDMVHRILRSMFAVGLFDHPPVKAPIDYAANALVAQRVAEEGIVLLKNSASLLPLAKNIKHIAVIGGHADAGVLSGYGSSQVFPYGGPGAVVAVGGEGPLARFTNQMFDPSSPLKAIRAKAPNAEVRFNDGRYVSSAVKLAQWADVVIVFANQWMTEGADAADLSLPEGVEALVNAVVAANPKTIVVLQTGGPVVMPWLNKAGAMLEAWYPGARGGEAIANVLFGEVNPSGHLPMTFPKNIGQNPRPVIPGIDLPEKVKFDVNYTEGSDVGYRWFAKKKLKPLFPFGFGLSYTSFKFANLSVTGGKTLTVGFDVTNTGKLGGKAAPQVYLTARAGKPILRLIGFSKVALEPGQTQHVIASADPRLLADFDLGAQGWRISAGDYAVAVGRSSTDRALVGSAALTGAVLPP